MFMYFLIQGNNNNDWIKVDDENVEDKNIDGNKKKKKMMKMFTLIIIMVITRTMMINITCKKL